MITSDTTAKVFAAFVKFQADVTAPAKNGKGNYGTYVLLDDLVLLRKELAKHGLSFTQSTCTDENGVGVVTTIMHESGEWFESKLLTLPLEKRTPQGAGSAVTYARRYSLGSTLGVASEPDDDGKRAEDDQRKPKAEPKPASKAETKPAVKLISKALLATIKGLMKSLGYNADDMHAVMKEQGIAVVPADKLPHKDAEKLATYLASIANDRKKNAEEVIADLGAIPE